MLNEKMKLNIPEWIVRGFVAACCGLVITYGRSFVRDVVKDEVQPLTIKVDKMSERVEKLNTQVEVMVAIEKDKKTRQIDFTQPFNRHFVTNSDGIKLIPFNYGQNTNNY